MGKSKLVVGNMKMNLSWNEINSYITEIEAKGYDEQVVIVPSSLYLPYFMGNSYGVGIQNIAAYDNGAYTGEVSASQVVSMGIDYTLIGHSERREYFYETDEVVRKKLDLALASNLKVILCIGETEEERNLNKTNDVLKKQLDFALEGIKNDNIIIAYEPVWAIGTGKVPTNGDIEDTVSFIKETINELCDYQLQVLYGGSVNDVNIAELEDVPNVDGYLVGGASTKPDKFMKIIEVVLNK